ncbi:MAG: hypothetical protein LKJ75_06365 [Clostridia bacterium]|jgi:RimK family alpha-L-glutamate ligase|nr:hypothetical protein [Clostridia bacterium]MCI2014809.1 hypothetical protein [Clostridia bacterium]
MTGWILVGDVSFGLKDIKKYEEIFKSLAVDFKKVHVNDVFKEIENKIPDFVITAYFGNIDSESLARTRYLERLGVDVINTAECIENVLDKAKSIEMIENADSTIPIPKTEKFNENKNISIGFPAVLKINKGSQGKGVLTANNFEEAVKKSRELKRMFDDEILIQEYISSSFGKDIRFILCRGKYVVSFIRINKSDFRSNIAEGASIKLYTPKMEEIDLAENIGGILGINLGSVDFLCGDNGLIFCEANGMPGVKYTEYFKDGNPLLEICRRIAGL